MNQELSQSARCVSQIEHELISTLLPFSLQGRDRSTRWPSSGAEEAPQRVSIARVVEARLQGAENVMFLQARERKFRWRFYCLAKYFAERLSRRSVSEKQQQQQAGRPTKAMHTSITHAIANLSITSKLVIRLDYTHSGAYIQAHYRQLCGCQR